MPSRRILPSTKYLYECFSYDPGTGFIRWKQRPPRHFSTVARSKIWNTRYAGTMAGLINKNGYWRVVIDDRSYLSHRVIWKMVTGEEPPSTLDHEDNDSANNRWGNLRTATQTQQQWNQRISKINTSGHKGVCRWRSKWQAQIRDNGVNRYIGVYDTPEQAAIAYEAAARELHGEFYYQRSRS